MNDLKYLAEANMIIVKDYYRKLFDDERFFNAVCFLLAQAVENMLKYWLWLNGVEFARDHSIKSLGNNLRKIGKEYPVEIDYLSAELKDWITRARYSRNAAGTKIQIDVVLECWPILVSNIEADEVQRSQIDVDPDVAE